MQYSKKPPTTMPLGYEPPRSAEELQRRYAAGERYFAFARLANTDLSNLKLVGVNLAYADLKGALLWRTTLVGCVLTGMRVHGADLRGATAESWNEVEFDTLTRFPIGTGPNPTIELDEAGLAEDDHEELTDVLELRDDDITLIEPDIAAAAAEIGPPYEHEVAAAMSARPPDPHEVIVEAEHQPSHRPEPPHAMDVMGPVSSPPPESREVRGPAREPTPVAVQEVSGTILSPAELSSRTAQTSPRAHNYALRLFREKHAEYFRASKRARFMYYAVRLTTGLAAGFIPFTIYTWPAIAAVCSALVIVGYVVDTVFDPKRAWKRNSDATDRLTLFWLRHNGSHEQFREAFDVLIRKEAAEHAHRDDLKTMLEDLESKLR